jgi:alkylation response protein AidB-like acyl-CoA dehydrogenase
MHGSVCIALSRQASAITTGHLVVPFNAVVLETGAPWSPARLLWQVLGGNGYINDYPTGRFLRDAKLYEIGAGTSEIRRMLIGRELVKLAAQQGG